jgi:hypothetical protein
MAATPGERVSVTFSPREGGEIVRALLLRAFTGASLPDVVFLNGDVIRTFAERRLLAALDPLLKVGANGQMRPARVGSSVCAVALLDMQRGAVEATVAAPGGHLRIYCTHLCHLSEDQRRRQLECLIEIIDEAPYEGPPLSGSHPRDWSWSQEPQLPPVPAEAIVLGDFNCTPDDAAYALLAGEGSARHGRLT